MGSIIETTGVPAPQREGRQPSVHSLTNRAAGAAPRRLPPQGAPSVRPFGLAFARPAAPEPPAPPYAYDSARQLNVLPDGRPAAEDRAVLLSAGTTTSTAGSKTHFDD